MGKTLLEFISKNEIGLGKRVTDSTTIHSLCHVKFKEVLKRENKKNESIRLNKNE